MTKAECIQQIKDSADLLSREDIPRAKIEWALDRLFTGVEALGEIVSPAEPAKSKKGKK